MRFSASTKLTAGFSLVEGVVTLALIGLFLIIFQASARTVVLNRGSKYQETALRIANSKLQTMRTTAYSSLPTSGTFSDPLLSSLPSGTATLTMTDYNAKTKQADVVVSWRNPTGVTVHVQLTTLITQGGLGQ